MYPCLVSSEKRASSSAAAVTVNDDDDEGQNDNDDDGADDDGDVSSLTSPSASQYEASPECTMERNQIHTADRTAHGKDNLFMKAPITSRVTPPLWVTE